MAADKNMYIKYTQKYKDKKASWYSINLPWRDRRLSWPIG